MDIINNMAIRWAAQHDWFVGHGVNSENVTFIRVKETVHGKLTNTYSTRYSEFTSRQALRAWAGY